jgi:hypothetical protein
MKFSAQLPSYPGHLLSCSRQCAASLLRSCGTSRDGDDGGFGCGYGYGAAEQLDGGGAPHVAAAGADSFFRAGAGCGACYQVGVGQWVHCSAGDLLVHNVCSSNGLYMDTFLLAVEVQRPEGVRHRRRQGRRGSRLGQPDGVRAHQGGLRCDDGPAARVVR